MNRLVLLLGCVVAIESAARADSGSPDNVPGIAETTPGVTPEGVVAPISIVEGPGLKIGEGTVLHPIIGLETGVVSNVFFESQNQVTAGIMRLIAQIGTGSLSPQRLAISAENADGSPEPQNLGMLQYRADIRATYDFYLSGNDAVTAQDGLGLGALFRGVVLPQHTWSFLFMEDFQRLIRPTNFESTVSTNRDINRLQLGLQFAPVGRSISGILHYENVIDVFEATSQRFADRLQNSVGLTVNWRFRPYTNIFADATEGFYGGLGSASKKISSFPLTVTTGIQTLLTLNTTLVGRIGYTNGFYSAGPSYSAIVGGVEFGYRYARTGRVTLIYDYSHQDSIQANYFRDHRFGMLLEQQFVPFVLTVQPEIRLRHYEGVMTVIPTGADVRDDKIFSIAAGMRYNFRDSIAAVLEYRLSSVQTDYRYTENGMTIDPSYVRHELLAGVRAAL